MLARKHGQLCYLGTRCVELAYRSASQRLNAANSLWEFRSYFGSDSFRYRISGVKRQVILPEVFLAGLQGLPHRERSLNEVELIWRLWPKFEQLVTGRRRKQIRRSLQRQRRALAKAVTLHWSNDKFEVTWLSLYEMTNFISLFRQLSDATAHSGRKARLLSRTLEFTRLLVQPLIDTRYTNWNRAVWGFELRSNFEQAFVVPDQLHILVEECQVGFGTGFKSSEAGDLIEFFICAYRMARDTGENPVALEIAKLVKQLAEPHDELASFLEQANRRIKRLQP